MKAHGNEDVPEEQNHHIFTAVHNVVVFIMLLPTL